MPENRAEHKQALCKNLILTTSFHTLHCTGGAHKAAEWLQDQAEGARGLPPLPSLLCWRKLPWRHCPRWKPGDNQTHCSWDWTEGLGLYTISPTTSNLEAINYVLMFIKHAAILHFGNTYSRIQNFSQYCTAADYLACPALKPLLSSAGVTLTIAGSGGEGNREEN